MGCIATTTDRITFIVGALHYYAEYQDPITKASITEAFLQALTLCETTSYTKQVSLSIANLKFDYWIDARKSDLLRSIFAVLSKSIEAAAESQERQVSARLCEQSPNCLSLVITDSGEGISKDMVDHIFEPFQIGGHSSKAAGLSLSQAKAVISRLGGDI